MTAVGAQTRMELILTLRRGESLIVTMGIPLLFLILFSRLDIAGDEISSIDFLVPGILALSIIATAMVSFSISTGFDRQYGVLKLLGGSPLTRTQLIGSKVIAICAIEVVQIALVIIIGVFLDWSPAGGYWQAAIVMLVGTVCFAGLGLWIAGTLRAEGTLALSNGLFVLVILIGGVVFPLDRLPDVLTGASKAMPAAAFGDALRRAFAGDPALISVPFAVLVVWAVVFCVLAAITFKWE